MAFARLFRRKSLDQLVGETTDPQNQLRRALGPLQLTMLGVGAIVGAGIFSTVGTAAAGGGEHVGAGPALVISFLIVAVACGFSPLCYSAFPSLAPPPPPPHSHPPPPPAHLAPLTIPPALHS